MLERIQKEYDIKKLNSEELECLAGEIREFLVEKVSKTGGHLASNLGVVELTMALHLICVLYQMHHTGFLFCRTWLCESKRFKT